MSTSITEPTRKNVSTQFEAQASTEVSSTIGGQSVKFTINRPNKFKTPAVSNAQELDDILSTALIDLRSDGNSFTSGQDVTSWTNSGTGGSTYDAISAANAMQAANTPDPLPPTPPSFEVSGHPFSTHGAIKFDSVSTAGKSVNSESLILSNAFTKTDSFVLFLVTHEASQVSGNSRGMSGSPFCFFHDAGSADEVQQDVEARSALLLNTNNPSTGFPRITLNAEDTSTTPSSDENYAFSFGALTDSRFTGSKLVPDVTEAFVVRVDKDRVAHLYNSKALGFIDPSETDPVTAAFTQGGSFGALTTWSWEAIGLHGSSTWSYLAGSGVYTNYIATIGAFDTDIGDQQCRALARLLAEKYQIL